MKKFLSRILLVLIIPIAILLAIYLITDPYKTLRSFSLEYFDDTNRDYLSSELFLQNIEDQHYDSYIFGSSRGCGINTYHWLKYLPEGSKQFLFQGWGETLTGIEQKITYIDEHGYELKNAIVLLDIPGSFATPQMSREAVLIKHPTFSHKSEYSFQSALFFDFIQKPSQWRRAISRWAKHQKSFVSFDPNTNDWDGHNINADLTVPPQKDSLRNMTTKSRRDFLCEIAYKNNNDLDTIAEPLIVDSFILQLQHICDIFKCHNTGYRIIITPAYYYEHLSCNPLDRAILENIFGAENVYDYSGKNCLTSDYNNFSDPNHFGLYVGWHIIEDIYGRKSDEFE